MKKLFCFFLIITSFTIVSFKINDEISQYQKQQVRNVVNNYCLLMSNFANSDKHINNMQKIQSLFTHDNIKILDDLQTDKKILLSDYLTKIVNYNHGFNLNFVEDINNVIYGYHEPNFNKSSVPTYGQMILYKQISGHGISKTVQNVFIIRLSDFKIFKISDTSLIEPSDLWFKGMQYYSNKQHEEALEWFEKSANMNYVPAQYSCGVMYLLNEGCKHIKRKERDNKGVYWLQKAARYMPKASQDLDRLGVY